MRILMITPVIAAVVALGILSASPQEANPDAAKQGKGKGKGQQVDAPPVTDLTGSWVLSSDVGKASPVSVLILKQTGNDLKGEFKVVTTLQGLPPIMVAGAIAGSQVDFMSWFDYQGGEFLHWRMEYKDGHLVGKRNGLHSLPRKWRLDEAAPVDVDYVRGEPAK